MLVRYKEELSRPFDEAASFLSSIQTQLSNLCSGGSSPAATATHSGNQQLDRPVPIDLYISVNFPCIQVNRHCALYSYRDGPSGALHLHVGSVLCFAVVVRRTCIKRRKPVSV